MQILAITFSWLLVLIFTKCIYKKDQTHRNVRRVFLIFHKIHEVSLIYVTIALVL